VHVVPVAAMVALAIALPIEIGPAQARAEVPATPLTFGIPVPLTPSGPASPGLDPAPAPSPAPGHPARHLKCIHVGGAGHGVSASQICWWTTKP